VDRFALLGAVVLVGIAVGLALRWTLVRVEWPGAVEPSPPVERSASSPPSSGLRALAEEPAAAPALPARAELVPAPQRTPPPGPAYPHVTVVVRSAATGERLAGCPVRWGPLHEPLDQALARIVVSRHGRLEGDRELVTDEDGRVEVPLFAETALVWVLGDEGYGRLVVESSQDGAWLELAVEPDRPFVVRIVDADGEPAAGVELEIRSRVRERRGFERRTFRATTDEAGRATVRDAWFVLDAYPRARLFPCGAFDETLDVPLSRERWPERDVILALPPTGAVLVAVVDAAGRPYETTEHVRLVPASAPRSPGFEAAPGFGPDALRRPAWGGPVRFERVPLDRAFQVCLGDDAVLVEGPTHRGQTVQATLVVSPAADLVGRLLEVDESPAASRRIEIQLVAPPEDGQLSGRGYQASIRTEPDGRFRCDSIRGLPWAEFWVRISAGGAYGAALVPSKGPLRPGRNDLGTVVLADDVLATLLVTSAGGDPIENARVSPQPLGSGFPYDRLGILAENLGEGRYALHGWLDRDFLPFRVGAPGHASRLAGCVVGARDVAVVLETAGVLAGTVQVDPDLDPRSLFVAVRGEDGPLLHPRLRVGADGFFRMDALPFGPLRLEVSVVGEAVPIGVLDGLTAASDGAGKAIEIDLRGRLTAFAVEVVDTTGRPVPCEARRADELAPAGALATAGPDLRGRRGVLRFLASRPSVDLEVRRAGAEEAPRLVRGVLPADRIELP